MGDVRHHDDRPGDRSPRMGLLAGLVALFPAVVAVWAFPGFVTQDGPAHLYNAHILAKSIGPASPFRGVFAVRWEPLPNWAGHLALMGLVGALPPRAADRLMTTAMLVGFAGSVGESHVTRFGSSASGGSPFSPSPASGAPGAV